MEAQPGALPPPDHHPYPPGPSTGSGRHADEFGRPAGLGRPGHQGRQPAVHEPAPAATPDQSHEPHESEQPDLSGQSDLSDQAVDPASTVIFEAPSLTEPTTHGRYVVILPGVSGLDTTATAAGLGLALASVLPTGVLLVDVEAASPGRGLGHRFGLHAPELGALLPVAPGLVYRGTAQNEMVSVAEPDDHDVLLVHCGAHPPPDVLYEILGIADVVLLFTPDTTIGVESAAAAMEWLRRSGRGDLADGCVVVLAENAEGDETGAAGRSLLGSCRAVHQLPASVHTVGPGVVDPEGMSAAAVTALMELAHEVAGA